MLIVGCIVITALLSSWCLFENDDCVFPPMLKSRMGVAHVIDHRIDREVGIVKVGEHHGQDSFDTAAVVTGRCISTTSPNKL